MKALLGHAIGILPKSETSCQYAYPPPPPALEVEKTPGMNQETGITDRDVPLGIGKHQGCLQSQKYFLHVIGQPGSVSMENVLMDGRRQRGRWPEVLMPRIDAVQLPVAEGDPGGLQAGFGRQPAPGHAGEAGGGGGRRVANVAGTMLRYTID